MATATKLVANGEWAPPPPTDDNRPTGKTLEHALRVAEELDLGK